MRWLVAVIVATSVSLFAQAKPYRSSTARAEFQRATPCPANGNRRGPCPGYVVDHVVPLCAGGPDHPGNLQWQTRDEAKAKDREEVAACRSKARN